MSTTLSPNLSPNFQTIPERLTKLRAAMRAQGFSAYIIASADPHLSEYLPGRWKGREFFSGFTGSVGTLIVTDDFAGVWADTRYWSQAEQELAGTGISLMKIPSAGSTLHIDWLASNLSHAQVVGIDGDVLSLSNARLLTQAFASKGIVLSTKTDLLEQVWEARPGLPAAPVYEHVAPFAAQSRTEKLQLIRQKMRDKAANWHFISTVDDLAWCFNLRGSDVSYNPVFVAHALIGLESATIFVESGKIDAALEARLAEDGITIAPYAAAKSALAALASDTVLLIDPRRMTFGFRETIASDVSIVEAINPSVFAKSIKNSQEIACVRTAMEQDGAALCEFFSWLETNLGQQQITELTIHTEITAARARQPHFISPSFGTIAGFNANGAMPHYAATEASHSVIEGNGLLLIDSGGQYLNGTTDITRMVPIGIVSEAQKNDCALVLKGMIALSRMQFPRGTLSPMLDTIARAPIWSAGINYGHGTGHGVGYFLNVHEGPQSISCMSMPEPHTALESGMITSNEPGIYRPGEWGVRIENLMLSLPSVSTQFGDYLKFETLTLCPIDTRCIQLELLNKEEKDWLNDYHSEVAKRLAPYLSGAAKDWLTARTLAV